MIQMFFLLGTLDRYPARPNNLESMCLHEFVPLYKTCSKPLSTNDARAINKETQKNMQQLKRIQLKDNMGYMLLRQTPAIVRYHQWSTKKQAEQYFHAHLLLYFPWRMAIAAETEKEQMEEEIEGAEIECNPMNAFEFITQQRAAANFDSGCTLFRYEMLSEEMPTSEWI